MPVIGKFKITDSFKITGRGLVVVGNIIEGLVKVDSQITFATDNNQITLQIKSVEWVDKISAAESCIGLLFHYKDAAEKIGLESLKLEEQTADITT